eukprot:scaffold44273_cov19-Prasinocladus_malaysianus.AAC.1
MMTVDEVSRLHVQGLKVSVHLHPRVYRQQQQQSNDHHMPMKLLSSSSRSKLERQATYRLGDLSLLTFVHK